jgi:hypothetical protein
VLQRSRGCAPERRPGCRDRCRVVLRSGCGRCRWLAWLARPYLLPLSTGPDLTHHLILIRYIEEHWRLVHDASVERFLGEMAQYTPGSHILAALAGAWSGTDGLRSLHMVQALAVALESGFLVLISRRLMPAGVPRVLALVSALFLLASPRYFLGEFTEYGFVAQVVAQLFVVAMWWATQHGTPRQTCGLACVWPARCRSLPVVAGVHRSTGARVLSRVALRTDRSLAARAWHLGQVSRRWRCLPGFTWWAAWDGFNWQAQEVRPHGHPSRATAGRWWRFSAAGLVVATVRRRDGYPLCSSSALPRRRPRYTCLPCEAVRRSRTWPSRCST